jgi:hypothetical protein
MNPLRLLLLKATRGGAESALFGAIKSMVKAPVNAVMPPRNPAVVGDPTVTNHYHFDFSNNGGDRRELSDAMIAELRRANRRGAIPTSTSPEQGPPAGVPDHPIEKSRARTPWHSKGERGGCPGHGQPVERAPPCPSFGGDSVGFKTRTLGVSLTPVGHGGRRVGAGRPPLRLADLLAEGRFDAGSGRHRRLLDVDELPDGADPELARLQSAYRLAPGASAALNLARRFAALFERSPATATGDR